MITSRQIKDYASSLGFDACGICKARFVGEEESRHVQRWIDNAYHADMEYMARNTDKRCDPTLLVENARSVVCVAMNYYPDKKQPEINPQFAYYAYGKDYHGVVKISCNNCSPILRSYVPKLVGDVLSTQLLCWSVIGRLRPVWDLSGRIHC